MNSIRKRRVLFVTVFLIGLIGLCNLFAGFKSLGALNALNLQNRIGELNSVIESFNPEMVKTVELRTHITYVQDSMVAELNILLDQSQILTAIPLFFIGNGILFLALSIAFYYSFLWVQDTDD